MKRNRSIIQVMAIAVISMFIVQLTFAQQDSKPGKREQHKEKIKTHKIAFLTDKLDLTPKEAEKFWPVYNAYEAEMEEGQKVFRKRYHEKAENIQDLSEEEALEFVNDRLNLEQNKLNLKMEFNNQLIDILPAKKVLMLMQAEKEFRIDLMKRLSGPRDGSRGPRSDQRK